MLPSMPILFSNSQDGLGNRAEPSTSYFHQGLFKKPPETPAPPLAKVVVEPVKVVTKETKGKSGAKKKEQKATPPKLKENALETALVRSYYTKVQSKFSSNLNVPANKFIQFQSILKSFNPTKETPVDLYKKIEQIFGEAHSDVVEEFLLFLKPGQAAQVGRFMDYFMLVQLTGFIDALQVAFARKPTVHRKILRALTNSINTGNSDQIKSRVLPHLRSNPKLAQAFRSLFPDERPPDSCYEAGTETLSESFLTSDRGCDEWELEGATDDRRSIHPKETLDTMYLHGRVFLQHGRNLRSARVIYPYSKEPYRVHARRLAPDLCQLSPPDSDEEQPSPKRSKATPKIPAKRAKKQTKSPTKATKDVNDNTSKCVNSPKNIKKTNTKKVNTKKDDATKTKKEKALAKNQEATKSKAKLDAATIDKKEAKITVTDTNAKKSEILTTAIKETKTKIVTFNLNATSTDANKGEFRNTEKKNHVNQSIEKKNTENTSTDRKTPVNTSTDRKTPVHTSTDKKNPENMSTDMKNLENTGTDRKNHDNMSTEKKNHENTSTDKKNNENTSTDKKNHENTSTDKKNHENTSTDMKSWTRDEDKTMLQVLKGEAGSEQIFGRIKELLPHRSSTEIQERFCHVMNLLQQMAVGEVT